MSSGAGLDLVTVLAAFAPLVVVPLGLPLVRPLPARAAVAVRVAGAAAAVALVLPVGTGAAALAGSWLLACLALAVLTVSAWARQPSWEPAALGRLVALGYLAVGAGWLVASLAGLEPLGFTEPIVRLTAVHFHYAGFAATTIAAALLDAVAAGRARRIATAALALVVVATAVVAAGHVLTPALEVAGAVLLTAGLLLVAGLTWSSTVRSVPSSLGRWLLGVSSIAVPLPMLLAVQYALNQLLGTPWVGFARMAQLHGLVNAVGFCLCGLLGWRLARHPSAEL